MPEMLGRTVKDVAGGQKDSAAVTHRVGNGILSARAGLTIPCPWVQDVQRQSEQGIVKVSKDFPADDQAQHGEGGIVGGRDEAAGKILGEKQTDGRRGRPGEEWGAS